MVYFFTIYLKLSEIDVSLLDVERPLSVKPSIFVAFASLLHVGGPHWGPSILEFAFRVKVEKILKGSMVSILSPSVKIQIMGRKVC